MSLIRSVEVVRQGTARPAPLNVQFDTLLLDPHLADAEERWLVPMLCRELYEDMITQRNTNNANYNPDFGPIVAMFPTNAAYEALWIKYLYRYTAQAVVVEALPFIYAQIGSNGVFMPTMTNNQPASMRDVQFLRTEMTNRLDATRELIESYLCENKQDFTLYPQSRCKCKTGCTCDVCKRSIKRNGGVVFY